MKTNVYLLSIVMTISVVVSAQQTKLSQGISEDWFAQASTYIQNLEQGFRESTPNQFLLSNKANAVSFMINPEGYSVMPSVSKTEEDDWNAAFKILETGSGQNATQESFVVIRKSKAVIYQYPDMAVEYVNENNGLRQNFIINKNNTGKEFLSVKMKISSTLNAALAGPGKLIFYNKKQPSSVKLIYDDLKVWDANGKILPSYMQLNQAAGILEIIVDDKNAVYPVTVDPLNRTAEWTTSADGLLPGLLTNLQLQVETLYGYTVAGLGDINGDGYDDVAVSAPTMADVITGSGSLAGVGAVFIYLGSPTGLPIAPSKVLQPNTAVAGALFGLSVDAGDITGDGKNDIVIGAPMDRYQTTAQGLLGTANVNVTAGKVYVYRSEDLFSAPNPTPFLQIRLQGTNFFSTGIVGLLNSNVSVNALFGYSLAVTDDLNNDGKADIIIGSPSYLGVDILSVQSGAAFIYYSNDLSTIAPLELKTPTPTLLGLPLLPLANTSGLLFGYSVDGVGDYNSDGYKDVVVGAPAGVDLSSLGGIFSGQFLGGSAYVYYGNAGGINNNIGASLQASSSGLLSNAANLFGYKVKGVENILGERNGNILVGAPAGNVVSNVLGGLQVKAGTVNVFVKKGSSPSSPVLSTQTISSPRSSSILSILSGQTINVSLLYGSSMDNMFDVNCDDIGDIIVGEPLSTAVPLIGADVVGGAAYIYLGKSDGTYIATPFWDLYNTASPLLGVNTTALVGYSVAGAGYVKGRSQGVRALVGGPSNSLDFSSGLLNLGNTLGTTFDFVFDDNGLGKSYMYQFAACNITTLPSDLLSFTAEKETKAVQLKWETASEQDVNFYELQRSVDGSRYEVIAMVFAKNANRNNYDYLDRNPVMGVNYYRLKTVDNNGSFKYSNVITVRFDEKLPGDIVVSPNPVVSNDIRVKMTGLEKGNYRFELYSAGGQLIQTKNINVIQHDQVATIQRTAVMSPGVYLLSVYNSKNTSIQTMRVFIGK